MESWKIGRLEDLRAENLILEGLKTDKSHILSLESWKKEVNKPKRREDGNAGKLED